MEFKGKLVAKDHVLVFGVDFQEIFSLVIKLKSICLLIAIMLEMNSEIHQMSISAPYLNGVLEDDTQIIQSENTACHLSTTNARYLK